MTSLNTRASTWWIPGLPLAVGGPSNSMKMGASSRSVVVREKTSCSFQCLSTLESTSEKLTRLETGSNICG